jgi:hypothetical protein
MASSPLNTPFDQSLVPDPSGSFATTGGFDPGGPGPGDNPLNTPYDNATVPLSVGPKETANSQSGLPLQNSHYNVGEQPPTNAPDISSGQIPVAGLGQK